MCYSGMMVPTHKRLAPAKQYCCRRPLYSRVGVSAKHTWCDIPEPRESVMDARPPPPPPTHRVPIYYLLCGARKPHELPHMLSSCLFTAPTSSKSWMSCITMAPYVNVNSSAFLTEKKKKGQEEEDSKQASDAFRHTYESETTDGGVCVCLVVLCVAFMKYRPDLC